MASAADGPEASRNMSWSAARALAARLPDPLKAERVELSASAGRVLASAAYAVLAAPPFDAAAMDGFAVRGTGPWRIVGRVLAGGSAWSGTLTDGDAVEIATGAVVPVGAEAVVPYEQCRRDGRLVTAERDTRRHIRRAGEDALPGDELAPAGRRVSATLLAAAAQAGLDELSVHRRPRVALLITGDEVVLHGRPGPGQVRDALAPVVTALVTRAGGEVVEHRLLADHPEALRDAIGATQQVDVVVITGSSSAGAADHLRGVLATLGAYWHVDGVACRPGRPQSLASTADGRWIVGLPGNPFAGLVAGLTILEPLVAAMAGRTPPAPVVLPVTGDATPHPHGVRLVPVRVGQRHAEVVPGARSGSLRIAAVADALAVLDPNWRSGTTAELLTPP
ncbi:molybdopterin molybdotransferase MoeA [Plantactinospora endophytica]|nr:molybdopterin molybdotransferase MoeA [Plantactinospora endophytica]